MKIISLISSKLFDADQKVGTKRQEKAVKCFTIGIFVAILGTVIRYDLLFKYIIKLIVDGLF